MPYTYDVQLQDDTSYHNPREWDNVGTIALYDRVRYNFGEEQVSSDALDEIRNDPNLLTLPIYMYDHSGITISTSPFSCRWDSGLVGVIYCTKEKAKHEWPKASEEEWLEYLESEITVLDQWLRGEVYEFNIWDEAGNYVDGCLGYFDKESAIDEAKSLVAYHNEQARLAKRKDWLAALKEARERRYWLAREIMTA